MYGIVENLGGERCDLAIEYIATHYKELENKARGFLKSVGNDVTMAGDLLNDTYMAFEANRYDRCELLTESDACNVITTYLSEAARHEKYKGKEIRHGKYEVGYLTDEEGKDIDIADTHNTEDELADDDYSYTLAMRFMDDTLEEGAESVGVKIAALTSIISNVDRMTASEFEAIETAVRSMAFKDVSDEFKEAFRVLLHRSIVA